MFLTHFLNDFEIVPVTLIIIIVIIINTIMTLSGEIEIVWKEAFVAY
jgi:hypothetical protein